MISGRIKVEKCKKMSNTEDKEMQDMYCKNCGKEIKEGNSFCTNCGKPIENNKQENIETNSTEPISNQKKKGFKIRVWHIIAILIILLCIIVTFAFCKKDNINNDTNNTKLSETSATVDNKKGLIDVENETFNFTEKELVDYLVGHVTYNYMDNGYKTTKNNDTTSYTNSISTGAKEIKVTTVNGKVKSFSFIYNTNTSLSSKDISLEKTIQAVKGINALYLFESGKDYKELSDKEQFEYIETFQTPILHNTYNSNLKYSVDENFNTVITTYSIWVSHNNTNTAETTNNQDLLETIYAKYPELKDKDGYICTNGEEYWILNEDGKKIYFDSLESFENATSITGNNSVKETETANESIKDSNNSNQNNKTNINNNSNSAKEIWIYENDINNLSEESLYKFLTNNNLKYNVTTKTENVIYLDKKAGNSYFKLARYGEYQSGSTVEIIKTTYVGTSWNAKLSFTDLADISINYNGGNCTFSKYAQEDYTGFLENPEGKDIYYVPMGMQYYINGDLLKKNDYYYQYTFNNSKTANLKIVVPYLYSYNEQKVINQNVTIYQRTINLEELYNSSGEVKKIDMPSRKD